MHKLHNYLKTVKIVNRFSVGRYLNLCWCHAGYALNKSYFTLF